MFFRGGRGIGFTEHSIGKETVDTFAAEFVEVVRRIDLNDLDVFGFAIELINAANGGELFARDVLGPIAGGGDQQHWFGREHRGNFDVVSADAQARSIFAKIAALHDGGNHIHGRGETKAVINGGEQEGLRATAGCARYGEAGGIDIGQCRDEIGGADGVPELQL